MKKLYSLGVCLLLCLFLPFLSKADTVEIAGAEMTYKWISGNNYAVQLNIYTKCNYTSLDSVWIKVSSLDNGFKPYKKLAKLIDMGEMQLDCHNHDHWSSCDDPTLKITGIRKWVATTEFTLTNDKYCRYFFSWDTCCRTKIITTGPALNHFYINAYMRICEDEKNSSPYFTSKPSFMASRNFCNEKRNSVAGANDTNYNYKFQLIAPRQSASTSVIFDTGYSYTRPFFWSATTARPCSDLNINDTGMVNFESPVADNSVVAFNFSRYDKNGVLQSRINRDVMYMLMDFPTNHAPIISGINGGNQTSFQYYAGMSACFTLHSFDVDEDSVKLTFTGLPYGADFDVTRITKFPKGTFCWQPDSSQVSSEPYIFNVIAEDNRHCTDLEYNSKSSRSFAIYVCEHNAEHSCYLGVTNESSLMKLQLYPQPAQNVVYTTLPQNNILAVQITDMAGRIFTPNYIWEGEKLKIDLQHLTSGSYFLQVKTKANIYHSKLVIQK